MDAGSLIHQQPSAVPMVSGTTAATNAGCVPIQFFNGFLDDTDGGLIHQQQHQQVPLQQILRTQMPGFSFFDIISDSYHHIILFRHLYVRIYKYYLIKVVDKKTHNSYIFFFISVIEDCFLNNKSIDRSFLASRLELCITNFCNKGYCEIG